MTHVTAGVSEPASHRWWDIRHRIPSESRAHLRRVIDPALRPVGSIREVATHDRTITLTFDDGPDPDVTPRVLQHLNDHEATATFFVLIEAAVKHASLTQEILAAGHDVALHGLDHRRLTEMRRSAVHRHVAEGRERLESLLQRPVPWIRPPYGALSPATVVGIRQAGLTPVVWGPVGYDWTERTEESVAESVMSTASAGAIVLLHDGLWLPPSDPRPSTDRARAAALVLSQCRDQGLRPICLSHALASGGAVRSAWFRS